MLTAPPWVKPNRSWPALAATSAAHLAGSSPARMWSIVTSTLLAAPQSAAHLSHQTSKAGTKWERASTFSEPPPAELAGLAAAGVAAAAAGLVGAAADVAAGAWVPACGEGLGAPPQAGTSRPTADTPRNR